MNKNILCIEPFREMYKFCGEKMYPFIDCGRMNILSVLKFYKRNYLQMMIGINFIYELVDNSEKLAFAVRAPYFSTTIDILCNYGIRQETYSPDQVNLIDLIIQCIDRGHPVGILIDLYYQKGRDFYYKLRHGGHNALVYGIVSPFVNTAFYKSSVDFLHFF